MIFNVIYSFLQLFVFQQTVGRVYYIFKQKKKLFSVKGNIFIQGNISDSEKRNKIL